MLLKQGSKIHPYFSFLWEILNPNIGNCLIECFKKHVSVKISVTHHMIFLAYPAQKAITASKKSAKYLFATL